MTETWVLAADSAHARIFRVRGPAGELEELKSLLHPESRVPARERNTDRQGRAFDSAGPGRHAMSPNVSPGDQEAERFAGTVADEIETARIEGRCDRLVIAAAPSFLGHLRKALSKSAGRLVAGEVDKDLVHLKPEEIRERLPDDLFA